MWVKAGGDKGGGTFKAGFQLCNVPKPNSPENTCLFCVFEAPDLYVNLHVALDRYRGCKLTDYRHTHGGKTRQKLICTVTFHILLQLRQEGEGLRVWRLRVFDSYG